MKSGTYSKIPRSEPGPNPQKQEKYQKEFTVYVKGQETYDAEVANAVAADIEKLARIQNDF